MQQDLFGKKVNCQDMAQPFALVCLLNRFINLYQSTSGSRLEEHTWKQMLFLYVITLFKNPPTVQDMADFIGSSNQNANKLYSRLLKDGYLTSKRDELDRRKQRLYLTEKGNEFLNERQAENTRNVMDIFTDIPEEDMEVVIDVMSRVTDRLNENYRKES